MPNDQPQWLTEDELFFHRMVTLHRERAKEIVNDELPISMQGLRTLIVHCIPQECVKKRIQFDGQKLKEHGERLGPLGSGGWSSRFNVDGWLHYYDQGGVRAYSQIFRDGRLESASSDMVYEDKGAWYLGGTEAERAIIRLVPAYLKFCRELGLNAPVWIFSALIGCKGVRIYSNRSVRFREPIEIDRSPVFLPEIKIDSFEDKPDSALRPLFDGLWQAAGQEGSPNFDEDENWKESR